MSDHYIGEVIEFCPRVTGGYVTAVVLGVYHVPQHGVTLDIRVTDGTAYWPPGTRESISAEVVL